MIGQIQIPPDLRGNVTSPWERHLTVSLKLLSFLSLPAYNYNPSSIMDGAPGSVTYPLQLASVSENHAALYAESLKNPEQFWGDLARRRLRWIKEFDQVMDCDMQEGRFKWFIGGTINVSGEQYKSPEMQDENLWHLFYTHANYCHSVENCLDRHAEKNPDKPAFIWEKDEPGKHEIVTYA